MAYFINQIEEVALAAREKLNRHAEPLSPSARPAISSSNSRSHNGLDWKMLWVWLFIVLNLAALAFAGYIIWAKCNAPSPF